MNKKTGMIVTAALMAALTCAVTMIIKIPSPFRGYLNPGDCFVLAAGWMLSPVYGFLAAGLGSALADMFSGYVIYAPATFIIKGLMALISFYGYALLRKKAGEMPSLVISGAAAEIVMIFGYFVFEGLLYGFVPSLVNIPANGIQGLAGLIIGVVLIRIVKKNKMII